MKSSVAVLFFLGCAMSSASAQFCSFLHPGNGGVLSPWGTYIPGSVLTWVDVSNCAKKYADPAGVYILENKWNDASRKFDAFMKQNNMAGAFAMLHQANNAFAAVAPHIKKPALAQYFRMTNQQFGQRLATGNIQAINAYMVDVHDKFKQVVQ